MWSLVQRPCLDKLFTYAWPPSCVNYINFSKLTKIACISFTLNQPKFKVSTQRALMYYKYIRTRIATKATIDCLAAPIKFTVLSHHLRKGTLLTIQMKLLNCLPCRKHWLHNQRNTAATPPFNSEICEYISHFAQARGLQEVVTAMLQADPSERAYDRVVSLSQHPRPIGAFGSRQLSRARPSRNCQPQRQFCSRWLKKRNNCHGNACPTNVTATCLRANASTCLSNYIYSSCPVSDWR